jgi:hypothetical protein
VIAAEATPADDPGKRSLDDPSSGLGTKPFGEELVPSTSSPSLTSNPRLGTVRALMVWIIHPKVILVHTEGAAIVAVSPDQLETGKLFLQWLKQCSPTFLVRFLGSRHLDCQQVALHINERVTFPAPRFFAHIVAHNMLKVL